MSEISGPPPVEPGPGLEDPRMIHPSPEDVVSDPAETTADEHNQVQVVEGATSPEDQSPEEFEPGIVDPRIDRIGPDL
jgi:hypothetical protein